MANKKVKAVYFNLDEEQDICDYADTLENFSRFVKEMLAADKRLKDQCPPTGPTINPHEIAVLVRQLVKTELAGHLIVTDQ